MEREATATAEATAVVEAMREEDMVDTPGRVTRVMAASVSMNASGSADSFVHHQLFNSYVQTKVY